MRKQTIVVGARISQENYDRLRTIVAEVYTTRYEAMKREKEMKAKKSKKCIEYLLSRQSPESVRD